MLSGEQHPVKSTGSLLRLNGNAGSIYLPQLSWVCAG